MKHKGILTNSVMSVVQIVVVSAVLFILYRFLLETIGAEKFGIWSLVLAATAVTQIADFGLSGGVVKFVAKYIARKENHLVSGVIQTAVLTIGTTVALVLIIGFPVVKSALRWIIPPESLPMATAILPFAFVALWLCMITSVFQSGLEGFQRFDIRAILIMGGALFDLLLCFWLVPRYGILGLAYAKVIQNTSVMTASWVFLRRLLPSLPVFALRWNRSLFREMIGYCLNFQVVSIASMLFDPITKALLSRFGSLSIVGFYEMASKMIQKIHSLIVAANQVLVPAIAGLKEKMPHKIQEIYLASFRLLFYLVFPLYCAVIISLPLISRLWIGYHETTFITFSALLAVGSLLNTLASPAYHANLGIGKLRWNVIGTIVTAILNVGLGVALGIAYRGMGVVIAWMVSLALGSSLIFLSYHRSHHIPFSELFPKASRVGTVICLLGTALVLWLCRALGAGVSPSLSTTLALLAFLLLVFVPYWRHPMRRSLSKWILRELSSDWIKGKPTGTGG